MEQTTRTIAAAARDEGANLAQSTFEYTKRMSSVESVGHYVPAVDEILTDQPQVQMLLANDLRLGVLQKLDDMILNGTGNNNEWTGLMVNSGVQTQAKGTDDPADAILKAKTKVMTTGGAVPGAVVINPSDFEKVQLLREIGAAAFKTGETAINTYNGGYIWGHPSRVGPNTIWGMRVVESQAITAGNVLVGDFARYCAIRDRQSVRVQVGEHNDDFIKLQKVIRAYVRAAFYTTRAVAFCKVTGF